MKTRRSENETTGAGNGTEKIKVEQWRKLLQCRKSKHVGVIHMYSEGTHDDAGTWKSLMNEEIGRHQKQGKA